MKRYIRATEILEEFDFTSPQNVKIFEESLSKALAENNCSAEFELFRDVLIARLQSYKGQRMFDKHGDLCLDGYTSQLDPLKVDLDRFGHQMNYSVRNGESVDIDAMAEDKVQSYFRYLEDTISRVRKLITTIHTTELKASDIADELTDYLISKGCSNVSVGSEFEPWFKDDRSGRVVDLWPAYEDLAFTILFQVRFDGHELNLGLSKGKVESGNGLDILTKEINKVVKKSSGDKNSPSSILKSMLADHGIAISSPAQYELSAMTYDRFESGKRYTIKFKCSCDYLAYLSMLLHKSPTASNVSSYFGDLYEFEEDVLNNIPTVAAMEDYASANWWGDGDDYILELKNLSTGEVLYSNQN